jgi:hypothetical protein
MGVLKVQRSILVIDLFWSSRSQHSITNALDEITNNMDAAAAMNRPAEPRQDTSGTDERIDQLLLVCAAMWELLREKTNLAEEDLITRVAEIDARDGAADGKLTYTPRKCPQCQRTVFPKHRRCIYCGADVPVDSIFKSI